MLFHYLLFFFVAVGAKLILALVMIYFLLPADRRCSNCDGETLLLQAAWLGFLSLGRVQRRWCPRCQTVSFARRGEDTTAPGVFIDSTAPTRY
jgi:phage FluMu protein Com